MTPRSNAWRFDAVIRALNEDVVRSIRSVHFAGRKKQGAGAVHSSGYATGIMRIRTTNSFIGWTIWRRPVAFLGISFGCARCHDHPVDPMSTEEYYQLTAMFGIR